MIALADSGNIAAAAHAVSTSVSHTGESGKRSLLKWKDQVKIMTTRITVIRRFTRKYRAQSLQCGIAPGLTTPASPQLISKVKDLLEKSNSLEGSKSRNLSTGALFSPNSTEDVQEQANQSFNIKLQTSQWKNVEGLSLKMSDVFKDHLALSPIQILLTLLSFQILKETNLLDEASYGLLIVTVIALDSRQEGTTATYNHVTQRTVLKALVLVLVPCSSTFEKIGVHALNDSDENGNLENPNKRVDLAEISWTFLAGFFMIVVLARRIRRRPLVTEIPATASSPLAHAAAPHALPAVVPAPPAIPVAIPAPLANLAVVVPAPPAMPIAAPAPPPPPVPIGAASPSCSSFFFSSGAA